MAKKGISRRRFISQSLAAAAAFTIVPRHVLGGTGFTPPSEILNHAVIGCGGMGRGHINMALGDQKKGIARLVALCDVDSNHLKAGLEMAGEDCKGYRDFREMYDRGDIDVIHIVTPPHWHALMSVAAAECGIGDPAFPTPGGVGASTDEIGAEHFTVRARLNDLARFDVFRPEPDAVGHHEDLVVGFRGRNDFLAFLAGQGYLSTE